MKGGEGNREKKKGCGRVINSVTVKEEREYAEG